MQILILNWRDPTHPLAGGAETVLLKHAQYWQKQGAEVVWFGSSYEGAKEQERIDGISYIRKGSHYTVHLWAFLFTVRGKFKKIDIVIDCFHFLPFFATLYLKKTKVIALIHEVAKDVWYKNLPWIFAFIGSSIEPYFFSFYRSNQFITVSDSTRKDLQLVGIPQKAITVITNGVDIPKVKSLAKSNNPVILFLGRISADKGIQDAIKAYQKVLLDVPEAELWIVGKEQQKGIMDRLLHKTKGRIRFFGFVSEQKKYELLQKAWILIHPSVREGWGLTVIEANSMGTPVVGYNVPGLRDSIQDRETGFLVNPDADSLARGVTALLTNKDFYKKLSINSKTWAKTFSWDKAGSQSWVMLKNIDSV